MVTRPYQPPGLTLRTLLFETVLVEAKQVILTQAKW
jgi:hypothetical protein